MRNLFINLYVESKKNYVESKKNEQGMCHVLPINL